MDVGGKEVNLKTFAKKAKKYAKQLSPVLKAHAAAQNEAAAKAVGGEATAKVASSTATETTVA
jgi:hypothetical protein